MSPIRWAAPIMSRRLTHSLVTAARALIGKIEFMGGMIEAVEEGFPKREIEAAAARRQARLDRGEDVIVGVNKFQRENEPAIEFRAIDNKKVRAAQIEKLKSLKAARDAAKLAATLDALKNGARADGNLLALAIDGMRARATVGEVSLALEVFGRHEAHNQTVSGVYGAAHGGLSDIARDVADFAKDTGRRPRVLVAKIGQDGHDRGANVIASAFGDLGFEVESGALFRTPEEVADDAVKANVDALGLSILAGSHLTLVPQVMAALKARGKSEMLVLLGGVSAEGLTRSGKWVWRRFSDPAPISPMRRVRYWG